MMRLDFNNMDEQSYDDTEPTPEPTPFRPPPPTAQPSSARTQLSSASNISRRIHSSNSTTNDDSTTASNTQMPSLLNQSLFSFSLDASINDASAASLPDLPMEPPSPISKPSESIFSESMSASSQPLQQRRSKATNVNKPKPMSEVRVINEEGSETQGSEDFYECLDDSSLARRTQQSIEKTPPKQPLQQQSQLQQPQSRKPPRAGTPTASSQNMTLQSLGSPFSMSRSITPSSSPVQTKSRAVNPSSDDVARVHENALQALMKMKEELMRANDRNQLLVTEKQILVNDRDSLQRQYEDSQTTLRQLRTSNDDLAAQNSRLMDEKDAWQTQRKELEEKARSAAKQQKDSMKIKLASENRQKEMKLQLDSIRRELEQALTTNEELRSEMELIQETRTQLVAENNGLMEQLKTLRNAANELKNDDLSLVVEQLQAEIVAKNEDIAQLNARFNDSHSKLGEEKNRLEGELQNVQQRLQEERASSQKELSRLKKALQAANDTLRSTSSALRTSHSPSRKASLSSSPFSPGRGGGKTPSSLHSNYSVRFQNEGFSFDSSSPRNNNNNNNHNTINEGATLETSIADRLARMRDSAERAHLIRSHKRELARLKADKETALQRLASTHDDDLKVAVKKATAQGEAKLEEQLRRLKMEYETKLEEVEAKHKRRFNEMQQEYVQSQEATDESLRAALSKLASASQQNERELASRKTLERAMEQLQTQMEHEKHQLQGRYAQDLEKRRHEWETERESLLAMIQKDCNSAIDRHRSGATTSTTARAATPSTFSGGNKTPRPMLSSPFRATQPSTATRTVSTPSADDYFLTVETNLGGSSSSSSRLSPSPARSTTVISPVYSDIDTVLRETEDLIQSIG